MRTLWIGLVLGTLVGFAACAGDEASDKPNDDGGGNTTGTGSTPGTGGTTGGGNGGSHTGSVQLVLDSGSDAQQDVQMLGDAACATSAVGAHLTTVNLIFMIDVSGSMGDQTAPGTEDAGTCVATSGTNSWCNEALRWDPAQAGLLAFFEEPGSSDLYAAMAFFAARGGVEQACNPASYDYAHVGQIPLTSLETSDVFATTLANTEPNGGTPTWPAVRGALDYATEVAEADPLAKTIVVLITDGEPGIYYPQADGGASTMRELCYEIGLTPVENTIPNVVDIVRQAYQGSPQILTYVFGITDVYDNLASLNAIARAGSGDTEDATIIETMDPTATALTLQTKLTQIRTNSISCDMEIPEPADGEAVDPALVNVYVSMDDQLTLIKKNVGCGTTNVGWQYDSETDPTLIRLCSQTCEAVQGNASAQLAVEFGCLSIIE